MEKKGKILVVDDSITTIQLINNILKDEFEVYFALNGADALKTVYDVMPDIILLDVLMPDMNGYEVIKVLKNDSLTKEIPVIFITAIDNVDNEVKGLEAGAVDYITKPIIGALLKARVNTHVELKKQRDILRTLSTIDGLTGIANRRMLDEYIDKYFKMCIRRAVPLTVIMADIDYFKFYNDTYGHVAGDECLKKIAHVIKDSLKRGYDLAARFGGEEFCCVLPETNCNDALKVVERIQNNVSKLKIEHKTSLVSEYVTLSIGVFTDQPDNNKTPASFLEMADKALYLAKNKGRNSVEVICGLK
ncbi:MAG: diguanylate cyclase [Deferribacterales bacterium]